MKNNFFFRFLLNVFHFSQRKSLLNLFLFSILFAVSGYGLKFAKLELDIYDSFDPNFPSSIDLRDMKQDYNDHTQVLVYFQFKENPTAGEICKLLHWSKEINQSREIKSATSLWSLRKPVLEDSKLWYKKLLDDPCGLDPNSSIELSQEYKTSYFNHLLSKTGTKDLLFDVSFADKKLDVKQVQNLITHTDNFTAKELKGVKTYYLGLAGFRYYFKKIMGRDQVISIMVLLIILVFFRFIYGTWRSGLYLIVTLIGTNIVLYGLLSLVGQPIDILTNNLFLMMAVAGTADFIFVTQYQMNGTYQESFEIPIVPCFFTTLTTVVGFLSLNTSDLDLIKRFGNGAALGSMVEWMMLFQFLPSALKVFNKEEVWVDPAKAKQGRWLEKIENFSLPGSVLKLFLILMFLSIPSFFFLNDQDSPVKNLPKDHVLREGYEKFARNFSWQGQVYLYFPYVLPRVEYDQVIQDIAKYKSVYKVEDPEQIANEWAQGYPPLKQDLIKRELSMSPLWEKYYSRQGSLRVPLYLDEQDLTSLRDLRDYVTRICGERCRLAGQRVVYLEYGEKISITLIESFGVSIFLVVGILGYLLWTVGKLQHFIPVILSALMGPLVILSLMALFQIQVTVITSIFLAIMVGLAGDNAVQYMMTPDGDIEKGIEGRARASILVTLVMIMASGLFIVQTLRPMQILGILFVLGFTVNLIGDLFGLKGLLTKKD